MKRFTIVLFALLAFTVSAQETTFKDFYKSHKEQSAF